MKEKEEPKLKTLVVNLYGGPCTGKTNIMFGVASDLKWKKIDCDIAPEYIKASVYEGHFSKMTDQNYIFGKQQRIISRLIGQVEVIITDSPLLLSMHYSPGPRYKHFRKHIISEYNRMNNVDILLERATTYYQGGRVQTEEEAKQIDISVKSILDKNAPGYYTFKGRKKSQGPITNLIIKILNEQKQNQEKDIKKSKKGRKKA